MQWNAYTSTEIQKYQVMEGGEIGYSVVDFCQILSVDGNVAWFNCVATIIWKQTREGWKESRWHCSLINIEQ